MSATRIDCCWCGKKNRTQSDYEQQGVSDHQWKPLCVRCANRRLSNPWRGLLAMRPIADRGAA